MSHKPKTLFLATGNKHKFTEARRILSKHGLRLEMVNIKTLEIQDDNLRVIALEALKYALKKGEMPLLVEDAGLFVEKLSGFPGPYSSYINRTIGVQGMLKLLEGESERNAQFKSAVACATSSQPPQVFLGMAEGEISTKPQGKGGFGFDPIFIPEGSDRTFAEMNLDEKNLHSHRAKALDKFAEWYLTAKRENHTSI